MSDFSDWIALGAALVALSALVVSIAAYRQRSRFHPQPKLEVTWRDSIDPDNGLFFRSATVTNHGDAPARDLTFIVDGTTTTSGGPWHHEMILEPTNSRSTAVPLVDRVVQGWGAHGPVYDRTGEPGDYRLITPTLHLTWRQAPFSGRLHKLKSKAPHTPNMLDGETS